MQNPSGRRCGRNSAVFAVLSALSMSAVPAPAVGPTELEAVTVSATRARSVAGETPQKITVITREEIENQLAVTTDPAQVLGNLIPSYSPSRQKLTNSGETFRGRSALVMIDGVPQSTPLRDSARDGYTVDLSMVERIEIIHGASAEHGLGATGGIINYVTRRPESGALRHHVGASLTTPTEGGSDGFGYKLDYRVEGRGGSWAYLAAASYQTRGVFRDASGKRIGVDGTQGDIMDSVSHDLLLKLGHWLTDDQHVELTVNRFRLDGNHDYVNVPGNRAAGIPATSVKGDPAGDAPFNDVLNTSLAYRHADVGGSEVGVQLYNQRFRARFGGGTFAAFQDPEIAPVGSLFDQSQNESDKLGGKLTLSRDGLLRNRLMLTGGIDVLQDKTRQVLTETGREWVPTTRFRNAAPFVQAELRPVERLKLQAGLRREFAELDVGRFRTIASSGGVTVEGGKPAFQETLYNAGIVLQATSWGQLFASYSEGFGMPDVGRVLRAIDQPGLRVDDFLDLRPIVTENREVGLRVSRHPFDFELSYFESDSDLGSRLADVGGVFQVRRERTEIHGMEASGAVHLSEAHRLQASYARVRGRSDTDGDGKVDTRLDGANMPPDRLTLRWLAQWSARLNSQVQASYFFDRSFDDPDLTFSGYGLVDVSASYALPAGRLTVGVENLLNEDYFTYYSQSATKLDDRYFKGRGRSVTVGYQLSF